MELGDEWVGGWRSKGLKEAVYYPKMLKYALYIYISKQCFPQQATGVVIP